MPAGVGNPFHGSLPENLLFAVMLTMMIGQIVAWKWERLGGSLVLGGFALFAIVTRRNNVSNSV